MEARIFLIVFISFFALFILAFLFGPLGLFVIALIGGSAVAGWVFEGRRQEEAYRQQEQANRDNHNDL